MKKVKKLTDATNVCWSLLLIPLLQVLDRILADTCIERSIVWILSSLLVSSNRSGTLKCFQ